MKIKNGRLFVYDVEDNYRNYLIKYDNKVSFKENRKFYGILITSGGIDYCIPFTCKVKKRNSKLTINIKHKNKVIAQLLINNMIPVNDYVVNIVNVKNEKQKEYLNDEISYLKKKGIIKEILNKTKNVFAVLNNENHTDYKFFKEVCCDFCILEKKCMEYVNKD